MLQFNSGSFLGSSMSGIPLYYDIVASLPTNYLVSIDSTAVRDWSITLKSNTGFRIQSNSTSIFNDIVYWQTTEMANNVIGAFVGATGANGVSGTNGTSGTNGVDGTDGTSGVSALGGLVLETRVIDELHLSTSPLQISVPNYFLTMVNVTNNSPTQSISTSTYVAGIGITLTTIAPTITKTLLFDKVLIVGDPVNIILRDSATATKVNDVSVFTYWESITGSQSGVTILAGTTLPIYNDNTDATNNGKIAGDVYRTPTGTLMIVY
jgi:hypothetical protein